MDFPWFGGHPKRGDNVVESGEEAMSTLDAVRKRVEEIGKLLKLKPLE